MALCIDFDGVMNCYPGYQGDDILFEPAPGLETFLQRLQRFKQPLVVHTARRACKVEEWLQEYKLHDFFKLVTNEKVPAIAYIDDRAVQHNGDFNDTIKKLNDFRVHWRNEDPFQCWTKEENVYGTLESRGIL